MTEIKDLLLAICSRVEPLGSTDSQEIFSLSDAKEARLAYELLTAHGFEAKLYGEDETSKLYVTKPANLAQSESRLATALIYARALKPIKTNIEALLRENIGISDFTLTFANVSHGKQIGVYLSPLAGTPVASSTTAMVAPAMAPPSRKAKKQKFRAKALNAGPTLAKSYPMSASATKGGQGAGGLRVWLHRYFILHIAANGAEILTTVMIGLVIITLGVLSRGWLCPDLATSKSTAWYCNLHSSNDDGSEVHLTPFTSFR